MKIFLSKLVSALLIPLLIPGYLFVIVLFLFPEMANIQVVNEKLFLLTEVIAFTAFFPLLVVVILYKIKWISSLSLIKREDRLIPQLFSLLLYGVFSYLLYSKYGLHHILTLIILTNAFSLLLITLITRFWKISTHTTGAAGFLVISSIIFIKNFSFGFAFLYLAIATLSIGVFFARLHLKAHTLKQVIYGGLFGLISGFWLLFFIY